MPWSSIKRNPVTGLPEKDSEGKEIWEGYCIDFIDKLADELGFEYDLVIPADKSFGEKLPNGKWTGLVGDLAGGVSFFFFFSFLSILILRRPIARRTKLFATSLFPQCCATYQKYQLYYACQSLHLLYI